MRRTHWNCGASVLWRAWVEWTAGVSYELESMTSVVLQKTGLVADDGVLMLEG